VCGARIEKRGHGDSAETNDHLHRITGADARHGEQGDARLLVGIFREVVFVDFMDFQVEQPGADAIVAADILLVAIEALPVSPALINLLR
jgi:hypothetical protein